MHDCVGFLVFFFGYPLNSFSQIGQYNEEVKAHNQKFEAKWKNLGQKELVDMGQGIFLVHCSQCHGITAEGLHGSAQNLVRWGKEEGIMDTIKHGSKGMDYLAGEMPAMELDEKDAKAIASYVMAELSSVKKPKTLNSLIRARSCLKAWAAQVVMAMMVRACKKIKCLRPI